jgi:molybdenum cofactor biosynthesis protein MoaC
MKDITNKISSLRIAKASAVLKLKPESVESVKNNVTPKKDVIATARSAGYLAVKNTSHVIPHCHPIPIDSVAFEFELSGNQIRITSEVKSIYMTGCEMEALYGASVAALTIYDMMKPVDKDIVIEKIKLESKSGGKTDFADLVPKNLKAAVLVISDSISKKQRADKAGILIRKRLEEFGIKVPFYDVVPDDKVKIRNRIRKFSKAKLNLIITTGGTGVSPRDNTPEAVRSVIEKEVAGIMEAARNYGQSKAPNAMLSRGIAGLIGKTLILTLPGSTRGAVETMDALFPHVLHVFSVLETEYKH